MLFLLASAYNCYSYPTEAELSEAISRHLLCLPLQTMQPDINLPTFATQDLCLTAIYDKTAAVPLWVTSQGRTEKAEIILTYLKNCYQDGLNPQDYGIDRLTQV